MEYKVENNMSAEGHKLDSEQDKIYFVRLNYSERVQHFILVVSFIVLVITGFMLKVPADMVKVLGKAGETVFLWRSILHRAAGTVMILVSIYHLYYIIFKPAGRRWITDMMPGLKDLKEMAATFLYYFGIKDRPPEYDRFCYKHKFEYGALFFGNTLMGVTGLLLWTESKWSKFILDISTLIHGMEAILATLAIIIWHLYEVHLRPHKFPVDNMWLTGVIDEEEMKEEYPSHHKRIMADPKLQKVYVKKDDK
jgi:cytochrome b subunit of formate dehydrogenase